MTKMLADDLGNLYPEDSSLLNLLDKEGGFIKDIKVVKEKTYYIPTTGYSMHIAYDKAREELRVEYGGENIFFIGEDQAQILVTLLMDFIHAKRTNTHPKLFKP